MNRLSTATHGIASWQERLANPNLHWKHGASAMETAISWELAANGKPGVRTVSGLPAPIERLFEGNGYGEPKLLTAVAEHKVDLAGGNTPSQCDVWAIVKTSVGLLSLTIEAKANEKFDEILEQWLRSGTSERSQENRDRRWEDIRSHLPPSNSYSQVRYQLLHRCAAAVKEARRCGFAHAAFIVQAFDTPDERFQDYVVFCNALNILAARGSMATTSVNSIDLSIGWADCQPASDAEVAAVTKGKPIAGEP